MNDDIKYELIYFVIRVVALLALFFLVELMVCRAEHDRGKVAYYEARYGAIEE